MPQLTAAQQSAIVMLTAAEAHDDVCAIEAATVAGQGTNERVLVGFSILECALSWIPDSTPVPDHHPVFGPALTALRTGQDDKVRSILVEAFTGRDSSVYATLLVQLAYLTRDLTPDMPERLRTRGLLLAADPDRAADRPAGS